ncbi:MAG: CbtA family protein [Nocardioides sp.]|nr:CbtA family protein [Nocardioides sp.]
MTARKFLIHGLIAGLAAGLLAFFVAHQVGEPHVETAIALEEAGSEPASEAGAGEEGHSHGERAEVSRANQRTFGLVTGTLAVGTALGGLVGLLAAFAMGRLGRFSPAESTAAVTLIGFVSFALLPFLKYPATPPAVGSGDTIGDRTSYYFIFLVISLVAAVAATMLARQLYARNGGYAAVLGGSAVYLVAIIVAAVAMPTVNELGDFPADTLWSFRISSLYTLATMWGVIGIVLTGLVLRSTAQVKRESERRDLVASL